METNLLLFDAVDVLLLVVSSANEVVIQVIAFSSSKCENP